MQHHATPWSSSPSGSAITHSPLPKRAPAASRGCKSRGGATGLAAASGSRRARCVSPGPGAWSARAAATPPAAHSAPCRQRSPRCSVRASAASTQSSNGAGPNVAGGAASSASPASSMDGGAGAVTVEVVVVPVGASPDAVGEAGEQMAELAPLPLTAFVEVQEAVQEAPPRLVDEADTPEAIGDMCGAAPPEPHARPTSQPAASSTAAGGTDASGGGAAAAAPAAGSATDDPFTAWWRNRDDLVTLSYAMSTGAVVAASVFFFDVSIQYIHDLPDIFSVDLHLGGGRATGLQIGSISVPFRCVMPIGAGFAVAWLQGLGFSPALKFLTRAIEGVVDDDKNAALPTSYWQVFRKAAASAITLGSGASLGPEAPSVELGANTAAVFAPRGLTRRRQRMLVAAGAAAGVSAAFDAPVTGALFAVEFVLKSSVLGLDRLSTSTVFVSTSVAAGVVGFLRAKGQALGITGAATHLVGRIPYFSIQPNLLVDVVQYSALGVGCAAAAVALYEGVRVSEMALRPLPRIISAPLGGALCGLIAFKFPQVQYGYVNLEEIFRDSTRLSAWDLSSLLLAKIAATSVCVGGGLVGGLFAPSLFLGALVGDIMGHFVATTWGLADPTTLVVVGAAAVLGAACRAPLTAIALMVEITRDTGLLVPLLAAIGVASLVSEYMEGLVSKPIEALLMDWYLTERAIFWGAGPAAKEETPLTVEDVISTPASLYVRHTLPLGQARTAMLKRSSMAAVVVDDNFTPKGLVTLKDVEGEMVKQQLLRQEDNNFDRQL